MVIFHLSMKTISRSAGRSATGAAAYRAGCKVIDQRTGLTHDYTKKRGVDHAQLILPGGSTADRTYFWNAVERHHKRGDAIVGREIEVSLPHELDADMRKALAVNFARELADRYGVGVDVAIHAPTQGDSRNHHAHLLMTPCAVTSDGTLGKKVVALDPIACKKQGAERGPIVSAAERERPRWEALCNAALAEAGIAERIDHRSNEARGLDDAPASHLGATSTKMERSGIRTRIGDENRRRKAQTMRLRDERLRLEAMKTEVNVEDNAFHTRRRSLRRLGRQQQHEQRPSHGRSIDSGPQGPRR